MHYVAFSLRRFKEEETKEGKLVQRRKIKIQMKQMVWFYKMFVLGLVFAFRFGEVFE
jgi:hypothetical protein